MSSLKSYEDFSVFVLLLLMIWGVYILLYLHYKIAFRLMQDSASYEKYQIKIDKAKTYIFLILKCLLWVGWVSVLAFYGYMLYDGLSLGFLFFEYWAKIPQDFWLEALFVIARIALVIALSRYLLKWVYAFLDKQQHKASKDKCPRCKQETIDVFYKRLQKSIKYTVVLGILYRISLYFPFLETLSLVLWWTMMLYVCICVALLGTGRLTMMKEKNTKFRSE